MRRTRSRWCSRSSWAAWPRGAAWCARRSARFANPLAVYAAVEAVVGLASLAFHPVFAVVTDWSYEWLLPGLGGETLALGAKLAVSCALILPQSVLLGMTFPLMSAGLARAHRGSGGRIAVDALLHQQPRRRGRRARQRVRLDRPAWACPARCVAAGGVNLAIALVVWLLARPARHTAIIPESDSRDATVPLLLAVAFFTGLASFVYEISWIRMLSLVLGASTHSFELMLATFILGLALGGLAVRRRVDTVRRAGAPARLGAGGDGARRARRRCRCTTSPSA